MLGTRAIGVATMSAVLASAIALAAQESDTLVEQQPTITEEAREEAREVEEERTEIEREHMESEMERDEELAEAVEETKEEEQELVTEYKEDSSSSHVGGAFNVQVLFLDNDILSYINAHAGRGWNERDEIGDHAVFMIGGMAYGMHEGGYPSRVRSLGGL